MTGLSPSAFRQRLGAGEPLVGTFVKTPAVHGVEILGALGFDFVVLDEEHAAFDRAALDIGLLACRVHGMAGLVRVAGPDRLLSALDCGAAGVLVPHVDAAAKALEVSALCRYRAGGRGFSGSPRAGGYGGLPMWRAIDTADASTAVIAQIEEPAGVDAADAIAAVEGIDALFVGRADLAVAMGESSPDTPALQAAAVRVIEAGRRAGKPVAMFVAAASEVAAWRSVGVTTFVVSSDQGFLRAEAARALEATRGGGVDGKGLRP